MSAEEHADGTSHGERMEDRDALEHAVDTEVQNAADHADISDDDDLDCRTSNAELADDLEALVQSIAAGNIPEWEDGPDLAADLVQWIALQEVPMDGHPPAWPSTSASCWVTPAGRRYHHSSNRLRWPPSTNCA